jgi:hypothetical protein
MLRALLPAALTLLLVLPAPTPAQQPELAAEAWSAASAEGLRISADTRGSYLAGRPVVITLRVDNLGADPVEFPRLDERPHLVSFELVSPNGKKQTRSNSAPVDDEDLRWSLPPRASRQVSLELPSGGALTPGRYQLAIEVQGEQAYRLGPHAVTIERPRPVAADVTEAGASILGWQVPWVHLSDGHELYLHTAPAGDPGARGYEWHLHNLSGQVQPLLAHGPGLEGANRMIYWREGERSIAFARLEERSLRHEPRTVSLPYPSWELLARAGADGRGGMQVPVWIPAPSGEGGEVRVVSVDARGQPRFRRVEAFDRPPAADSWVDNAGRLRLLLQHEGKLDLYTIDSEGELPAAGVRLLPQAARAGEVSLISRPAPPERAVSSGALVSDTIIGFVDERLAAMVPPPVAGVRFGLLPERGEEAGGMAVFTWLGDATGGSLPGVWLSIKGRVIATVPGVVLPGEHRVIELIPQGYDPCILVSEDREGVRWAHSAAWSEPVRLGPMGAFDGVRVDERGSLWLVAIEDGRGVVVRELVAPGTPAPSAGAPE